MRSINVGRFKLPCKIKRSNRSTLGLSIGSDRNLLVKAPKKVSIKNIKKVIKKKKPWILKKLYNKNNIKLKSLKKEFMSGEKLFFQGRRYKLKVLESQKEYLEFNGNKFKLFINKYNKNTHLKKAKRIIEKWYKEQATKKFSKRVKLYSKKIGVKPREIEIKQLNNKWGNFKEEKIQLNWRLIMMPVRIQNYIIVHELSHFKHSNHDPDFWHLVGGIIPDYRRRIDWLRRNGGLFTI